MNNICNLCRIINHDYFTIHTLCIQKNFVVKLLMNIPVYIGGGSAKAVAWNL